MWCWFPKPSISKSYGIADACIKVVENCGAQVMCGRVIFLQEDPEEPFQGARRSSLSFNEDLKMLELPGQQAVDRKTSGTR